MKIEAVCSSETPVNIHQTTRRYTPEDRTLHNYWSHNLNSYILFKWFPVDILQYIHYATWATQSVAKYKTKIKKLNSVALVREPTIPNERSPLVGKVSANFRG
jgi:hypothetical protein